MFLLLKALDLQTGTQQRKCLKLSHTVGLWIKMRPLQTLVGKTESTQLSIVLFHFVEAEFSRCWCVCYTGTELHEGPERGRWWRGVMLMAGGGPGPGHTRAPGASP